MFQPPKPLAQEFPNIQKIGFAVHTLNLTCLDITKLESVNLLKTNVNKL